MPEALLFLESEWGMDRDVFVPHNMWTKLIYYKGNLIISFTYSYKDQELYFNYINEPLFKNEKQKVYFQEHNEPLFVLFETYEQRVRPQKRVFCDP